VQVRDDGFRRRRSGPPRPAAGPRSVDRPPHGSRTENADPLPGTDGGALPHERHDAPRDEACNLHDADARPARGLDDEAVAFVVVAGLGEIGIEKQAAR
jgi:hypothetical protein